MLVLLPFLTACKGSDVYRGTWKALDRNGNKSEIVFDANSFAIKQPNGQVETFSYTQNSVLIRNSTRQYGIKLKDGRSFYVIFPIADNTSKAYITLGTMEAVYTIGRADYVPFDELFKM